MIQFDDEPASRIIKAFQTSFGEDVFHLACHAAVPVVITPELLHFLRLNFFIDREKPLSFKSESDVLLSPLCNDIGDGLYEISSRIRAVMLRDLVENPRFGEKRVRDVAAFLFEYRKLFSPWQNNRALDNYQQLTALNLLDPDRAKNWLEQSFATIAPGADSERQWFIAMRAELAKLDEVLGKPPEATDELSEEDETLNQFDDLLSSRTTSPPFPFNQQTFSRYEPIEQRVTSARVLVVDNYLRDEKDLSDVGKSGFGGEIASQLRHERMIAAMSVETILNNISRLVKDPTTQIVHLSDIPTAVEEFRPNAVVLSSSARDFDYYSPELIENFGEFIRTTKIPVLAINGGHLLVGMSFGARIVTLDRLEAPEQRNAYGYSSYEGSSRPAEYQYRFIRITEPDDPIFQNIAATEGKKQILRVWQNHTLQLDRVPTDFRLLATSYLCRNQMMGKRSDGQLIYSMQFHLDKSFEDWNKSRTRWEHPNESRDGRILFENFLQLAVKNPNSSP